MSSFQPATCPMCGLPVEEGQSGLCDACRKMRTAPAYSVKQVTISPFETNPLLAIWTRPRQTIRLIVEHDPQRMVLLLAALSGIFMVLDKMSMRNMGDRLPMHMILVWAIIVGPIGGIIGLYLYSALLRWTGRWIGGQASHEEVRAAWAWSHVILITAGLLWLPQIALFGEEMFRSATPTMASSPLYMGILFAVLGAEVVLTIWFAWVFLLCLSEVQKFSALKAALNSILLALVILGPIAVLVGIAVLAR